MSFLNKIPNKINNLADKIFDNGKIFLVLSLGLLGLEIVWISLRAYNYAWGDHKLEDWANIGDAIGGLTAPIVGVLSAILIYSTFREQQHTIQHQQEKANERVEQELLKNELERLRRQFWETIEYLRGFANNTYHGVEYFKQLLSTNGEIEKAVYYEFIFILKNLESIGDRLSFMKEKDWSKVQSFEFEKDFNEIVFLFTSYQKHLEYIVNELESKSFQNYLWGAEGDKTIKQSNYKNLKTTFATIKNKAEMLK